MNSNKWKKLILKIIYIIILIDEKSYEITLIYNATYKIQHGAKPFCIIFDGYVSKYDGTKYLALFHSDENKETIFNGTSHSDESKETIFDRVRYLILLKQCFTRFFLS